MAMSAIKKTKDQVKVLKLSQDEYGNSVMKIINKIKSPDSDNNLGFKNDFLSS